MESKIKIRLGAIEIEYEGSEAFLKEQLPALIEKVFELHDKASVTPPGGEGADLPGREVPSGSPIKLSTNSIAAKLKVASGQDLALAAAAHITLVRGVAVFSRKELLKEMKRASSYYKASYNNNLSQTLKRLLEDKFNEATSGNFALTASAKEELRSKLA